MTVTIETRTESARGCGYRKGGGKYMMGGKLDAPCGKLPRVLGCCPLCYQGIKPARGWSWIRPDGLFGSGPAEGCSSWCTGCSLREPPERAGLLWIGTRYYPRPADFLQEAAHMGISRRIPAVPKDFVAGETLVLLAHRDCPVPCETCCGVRGINTPVMDNCPACGGSRTVTLPAIFSAFTPTHLEYVVKGDEEQDELERLSDQGFKLVKVVQDMGDEQLAAELA